MKLSERTGKMRKTVLIPASGIKKLQGVLEDVSKIVNNKGYVYFAFNANALCSLFLLF